MQHHLTVAKQRLLAQAYVFSHILLATLICIVPLRTRCTHGHECGSPLLSENFKTETVSDAIDSTILRAIPDAASAGSTIEGDRSVAASVSPSTPPSMPIGVRPSASIPTDTLVSEQYKDRGLSPQIGR